mgnify:FL=1
MILEKTSSEKPYPKSPSALSENLAYFGGKPVRPEGPPEWPLNDSTILEVLQQAHQTGIWGKYHGPYNDRLQDRLCDEFQCKYAFLCCSGTFAVELALRAAGVKPAEEVILAAYDFSGNFHSILATGAKPVLVDINRHNSSPDISQLEQAISPDTRAIIVSHLHGSIAPMHAIMELAKAADLSVIEDAAQMPGAVVAGRKAGTWGDIGILSFGGSKLLSAGRGGALLTSNPASYQRMKLHCHRGNHAFALSELQAAILLPQIEKLNKRNQIRSNNVRTLIKILHPFKGLIPRTSIDEPDSEPSYYKVGFLYDSSYFDGLSREQWTAIMRAEGIAFDAGFRSLDKRSSQRCRKIGTLPRSSHAGACTVVLHHPILLGQEEDLLQIHKAVAKTTSAQSLLPHRSDPN